MTAKYKVIQDGAEFHLSNKQVYQAPFEVADNDLEAAAKARDWFLQFFSPGAIEFV